MKYAYQMHPSMAHCLPRERISVKAKTAKEPQSEKFKRLAREVEADEDASAFDERLRRVARQKPDKGEKPSDE